MRAATTPWPERAGLRFSAAAFPARPPRTPRSRCGGWPRRTMPTPPAPPGVPGRRPEPRRQDRVGHHEAVGATGGQQLARLGQQHAVRGAGVDLCRARLATGLHRSHQCRAGRDQVVDQHGVATCHRAHDEVAAGHHAAAAALVDDGKADVAAQARSQQFLQALRTLRAADVRRHDRDGCTTDARGKLVGHERRSLEVIHRAAERVLEGREIVRVERDDVIRADGFEQLRDVAQRHRIALLGAAILAAVGEERHARRDPRRAAILQAGDEEQQPAQPVVGAAGSRRRSVTEPRTRLRRGR